jgi:hypothetical protein
MQKMEMLTAQILESKIIWLKKIQSKLSPINRRKWYFGVLEEIVKTKQVKQVKAYNVL